MQSLIDRLTDQIDIAQVPFSDRGSRLLIYQNSAQNCLYLTLAERLVEYFSGIESYLTRKSYLPELTFVNGKGGNLPFQVTTKPHVLEFTTGLGQFKLVFQDHQTLCFSLPPDSHCGLRFRIQAEKGTKSPDGGEIHSIRNLVYSSQSKISKNQITSSASECEIEFILETGQHSAVTLWIGDPGQSPPAAAPFLECYQGAIQRWGAWFNQAPAIQPAYQDSYAYAWWVLANNLICPKGNIKFEMVVPSKKSYVGTWLWDNALHAIALRHLDPELARNQIRGVLVHQLPDGMLPDAIFDDGIVTEIDHPVQGKVTKPPILAWAALKIHEIDPDLSFLDEIYEPLQKWNEWWFRDNDDNQDGIVQYNHPYSSGLDDSPLWDDGMPVDAPDLNSYLYLQMKSLAAIAGSLDKQADAVDWSNRAQTLLTRIVDYFWDENTGAFHYFNKNGAIPVLTPFNLSPLWTGGLPVEINNRLIDHLKNPHEFFGDPMLPTVAWTDSTCQYDKMWRGPIWININYFFIEALQNIGEFDLAHTLREKTLSTIMSHSGMHEYYNSKTGLPGENAAPIFSWTAALFIDLAIQASGDLSDHKLSE